MGKKNHPVWRRDEHPNNAIIILPLKQSCNFNYPKKDKYIFSIAFSIVLQMYKTQLIISNKLTNFSLNTVTTP